MECNECLKLYSPINVLENFKIKNISDALALPATVHTVGLLKKQIGNDKLCALIEAYIYDYTNFINPSRNMSEYQIKTTAQIIADEFYNLKIPEVALVFRNAKAGHYKSIYEGIDGAKIIGFFQEYFDDRLNEAERLSMERHKLDKLDKSAFVLSREQVENVYEACKNGLNEETNEEIVLSQDEIEYRKFRDEYNKKQTT